MANMPPMWDDEEQKKKAEAAGQTTTLDPNQPAGEPQPATNTVKPIYGYVPPETMGQFVAPVNTPAPMMANVTPDLTGAQTKTPTVAGTIDQANAGQVQTQNTMTNVNELQGVLNQVPAVQGATATEATWTPGATAPAGAITSQVAASPVVGNASAIAPVNTAQASNIQTGPVTTISQDLLNQLVLQAQGQGPSAAQAQLQTATDANLRAMQAAAASQRGGQNPAVLRQLEQERAMAQQQAAGQSAALRAQEQQQAAQTAAGLGSQLAATEAGTAQAQAKLQTDVSIQNMVTAGNLAEAAATLDTQVKMSDADRKATTDRMQAQLDTQVSLANAAQQAEYQKFVEGKEFDLSVFNADQQNKIAIQSAEFRNQDHLAKIDQIGSMYRQGKLSEAQAAQLQAQLDTQVAVSNMEMALKAAQGDQQAKVQMNAMLNDYILKKMQLGMSYEESKAQVQLQWQQFLQGSREFAAKNQLERDKALNTAQATYAELMIKNKEVGYKKPQETSWWETALGAAGSVLGVVGQIGSLFGSKATEASSNPKTEPTSKPNQEPVSAGGTTTGGMNPDEPLTSEDIQSTNLMFNGGVVPGHSPVRGDSPKNDTVPIMVSPGEIVIPRSAVAQGREGMMKFLDEKLKEVSGQAAMGGYIGYDSVVKAAEKRKKGY